MLSQFYNPSLFALTSATVMASDNEMLKAEELRAICTTYEVYSSTLALGIGGKIL